MTMVEAYRVQLGGGSQATGIAVALHRLGDVARGRDDYAMARAFYTESLAITRALGEQLQITWSLRSLAMVAFCQDDYPAARSLYEELREGNPKARALTIVFYHMSGYGRHPRRNTPIGVLRPHDP